MTKLLMTALLLTQTLPAGYWPLEKSQPIIDKTQTIRLSGDLSKLSEGERKAVAKLIEAGQIFQKLYEEQRHPEALVVLSRARRSRQTNRFDTGNAKSFDAVSSDSGTNRHDARKQARAVSASRCHEARQERLSVGNQEEKNGSIRNQAQRDLLDLRTRCSFRDVQRTCKDDIATLNKYPALQTLHPRLLARIAAPADPGAENATLYSVPYAVAYADELMKAYGLLNEAADAVAKDDEEFARYLRNRARDLLSNDYESGDASWVTGRFKNLNAQIGSYETYDDELYGVKTFFSFCLLQTRQQETTALRQAMKGLQALEDSLPYQNHKKMREDIPVGVYDVVADFGQSRGGNTATILPNESYLARRYGRTILLRANIMRDQNIFEGMSRTLAAALGEQQAKELTPDGNFYRTLWHEVGHYLGVDQNKRRSRAR